MSRYGKILISLAFYILLVNPFSSFGVTSDEIRFIDGDTVEIGDISYRVLAIDTSEIHNNGYGEIDLKNGLKALDYLRDLRRKGNFSVEIISDEKGVYGRSLCDIRVDGRTVIIEMVAIGLARVIPSYAPPELLQELLDAEAQAIESGLGIWEDTNIKFTDSVYIARTGEKYHRKGSQYIREGGYLISKEHAELKGYTPSMDYN